MDRRRGGEIPLELVDGRGRPPAGLVRLPDLGTGPDPAVGAPLAQLFQRHGTIFPAVAANDLEVFEHAVFPKGGAS
jgi:hypothetical protein